MKELKYIIPALNQTRRDIDLIISGVNKLPCPESNYDILRLLIIARENIILTQQLIAVYEIKIKEGEKDSRIGDVKIQ